MIASEAGPQSYFHGARYTETRWLHRRMGPVLSALVGRLLVGQRRAAGSESLVRLTSTVDPALAAKHVEQSSPTGCLLPGNHPNGAIMAWRRYLLQGNNSLRCRGSRKINALHRARESLFQARPTPACGAVDVNHAPSCADGHQYGFLASPRARSQ